jgi:4-hydroxy-3-methylbut-2-enyl diphosphate reductase
METYIARPCGFCFGGKRSVDIANNVGKAYSLGPLLHNEQLVEKLREKGVEPISFDELIKKKPCKVIIRAHGVPVSQIGELNEKGFDAIDATCPNVKKIYNIAEECEKEGYSVFVYGDRSHPEVIGIVSRLKSPVVVGNENDIPPKLPKKICLVSQTTKIKKEYAEIRDAIAGKCTGLKAFDTICTETDERQKAASRLAEIVGVMLVVGGKDSSNTKKLFEVCSSVNENTHWIQSKKDLKKEWFSHAEKAGITAGASTPDFVISSVADELRGY